MKHLFAIGLLSAAFLGGCASAGYNPNAQEPSWSKSLNSMGNDVSNSVTPDNAAKVSEETNQAASGASNAVSPENVQKSSDETNRAASQADSSLHNKKKPK